MIVPNHPFARKIRMCLETRFPYYTWGREFYVTVNSFHKTIYILPSRKEWMNFHWIAQNKIHPPEGWKIVVLEGKDWGFTK